VFRRSTDVQSLLFDRQKWTVAQARSWLKKHGFKIPKVDTTSDYHRFRQDPPFKYKAGTFRTISFGKTSEGIKAVIAVPRKENPKSKKAMKGSRVPSKLVCLGACLEIEFQDGELYKPRGADLCASMNGRVLWIVKRKKAAAYSKQCKLYSAFHDFEPDEAYKVNVSDNITFKASKRVKSISYRSDKWSGKNVDYIHKFKKYPKAYADSLKNPGIIKISGARISIRPEGITG